MNLDKFKLEVIVNKAFWFKLNRYPIVRLCRLLTLLLASEFFGLFLLAAAEY